MKPSICLALALLASAVPIHSRASDELARYVAQPDASYRWSVVGSGKLQSGDYVEISLTSQTWRGIPWKHQLFLFRPKHMDNARQALLYIDGGSWKEAYENGLVNLPRQSVIFTRLADSIRAPVVVIRQVPFQPLFDRREDALIAFTFERYLETGEADWPLLLPMVKAATRAMDAAQAAAQDRWKLTIERFTVAGASKRGWTSWLTAAIDTRVVSVAPMVIDMLNIPEQIRLQRDAFGALSDQIRDYDSIGLPERIDSAAGRHLIEIVDPYHYRARLTLPKLILLGTNDRYWPLDALSAYWSELPEPKRVLYVPNQGHAVRDLQRVIGALSALHRYSARGEALPSLSWTVASSGGASSSGVSSRRELALSVQSGRRPMRVVLWGASSATRDFRDATWAAHRCRPSGREFHCTLRVSTGRFTAGYAEVTFRDARQRSGQQDFSLSTAVCTVDATGAMLRHCLDNARKSDEEADKDPEAP